MHRKLLVMEWFFCLVEIGPGMCVCRSASPPTIVTEAVGSSSVDGLVEGES